MSMDNDTRLMMMNLRTPVQAATPPRRRRRQRRSHLVGQGTAMAAFALTLFTRGV